LVGREEDERESRWEVVRAILALAWPVAASSVVSWSQAFFTIWLLGQSNKITLAAFGLANVLCNVTGHSLLWGLGAGLDTIASQAWGAKEYETIGFAGQRVLVILTFLVNVPVVAIWLNATPILVASKQDPAVAAMVASFARIRIAGLFCQGFTCVFSKILVAMGKTKVLLLLNLGSVGCSMGLSWLFIAKKSPASHLFRPIEGSALMSTVVDAAGAFFLLVVAVCDKDCRRSWPGWSRACWQGWKSYLKLAIPALLMCIFEWWSWDIVNFLAGLCPDPHTTLATNALLGNIISLGYAIPSGLLAGTRTWVGNKLGSQRPKSAHHGARVGFVLGVVTTIVQASALFLFRNFWAHLFQAEPSVGENVASLLPLVVFFNAGDCIQLVLSGVVTGAGKQQATPVVLGVSYWVLGLPLGAVAAFYYPKNELRGLWWGMTLAVTLHMSAYALLCFGYPHISLAIDWEMASKAAAERLDQSKSNNKSQPEPDAQKSDQSLTASSHVGINTPPKSKRRVAGNQE